MLASFLLSLREGLEAALIIGIVLGVLLKIKRTDLNIVAWRGVGLAVLLSFLTAIALNFIGMEFEGKGEEIFNGMMLEQYGKVMAQRGGIGLANNIRAEMIRLQEGKK